MDVPETKMLPTLPVAKTKELPKRLVPVAVVYFRRFANVDVPDTVSAEMVVVARVEVPETVSAVMVVVVSVA